VKPIAKSSKLADVGYDIRGPVLEKARQMQEEGHKIIQLNIGNLAVFGFDPPDEIVQDMIRNLPSSAGYTDSKGLFAPRKAVVHYTQEKHIAGVGVDDVYLGNGASELIAFSLNALLDSGDEILVPAPDYPLWTAAVSLSGGKPVHVVPAGAWQAALPPMLDAGWGRLIAIASTSLSRARRTKSMGSRSVPPETTSAPLCARTSTSAVRPNEWVSVEPVKMRLPRTDPASPRSFTARSSSSHTA
jgi:hypothetical protein